ncbi:flagellar hook-length control protein FliK [Stagnimonas aquatica]|uniref:Flagellar hook-length control protein FliK n=1 Tax=Stagnimonas aquatica TaxID=2689987 RepID=A0A3N0V4W9_9GAMM|nr:flagellar hook-length control protein FliK [Stagnimonas aquatica]
MVEGGRAVVPAEAASPVSGNQGAGELPFALPVTSAGGAAVPRLEPASAPMPTPVVNTARSDWPEQLSSQISWHLGREVQEARIALAPDDLGAIDLQVRVHDGRVQVHMGAAQATTRELLSEALPRLRELLGDSGLSLSQASVFSQDPQSRGYAPPAWQTDRGTGSAEPDRIEAPSLPPPRRLRGLFDHYA